MGHPRHPRPHPCPHPAAPLTARRSAGTSTAGEHMALKPCLGIPGQPCGRLSDGPRCERCRKATDTQRYRRRGTTAQRGLSGEHQRVAAHYRAIDAACECDDCGAHDGPCGRRGTPGNPITAGHLRARARGGTSADGYRPECRSCNSRRGARRG